MWPHHIVIGVDAAAITVASDDPSFIESLEPWRIELDTDLVDFLLELDPSRSKDRPGRRYLPRLRNGSCDLFRLRDTDLLTLVTRRVLASFGVPEAPGQVRVGLMPVVCGAKALLVPPTHGGAISHRWYESRGLVPVYGVSSVVDIEAWSVRVDPPLGSVYEAEPEWYPLLDWWLPSVDPTAGLTPGHAVAQVMRLVTGVAEANAGAVLATVARAVECHLPGLAPVAPDYLVEQLDPRNATELREGLITAIEERFAQA